MLAVVAVLAAGLQYAAHRQTAGAHSLMAPHLRTNGALVAAANDGVPDPPHVIVAPRDITRTPAARPAPSSSGGGSAPRWTVADSTQQALINADRRAHGLPPLAWSGCLFSVAANNARRIAAAGYLSQTNGTYADLSCGLGSRAGENIGSWSLGINDSQLNAMFMSSPVHYANIMGPYRYVATAWVVDANGSAYLAVEFS